MGDMIVIAVLGLVVAFIIRSMWKNHKNGGGCSGCSGCSGNCGGNCNIKDKL